MQAFHQRQPRGHQSDMNGGGGQNGRMPSRSFGSGGTPDGPSYSYQPRRGYGSGPRQRPPPLMQQQPSEDADGTDVDGERKGGFDAKRLRKAFMRRTVDYNTDIIAYSELRRQYFPPSRISPWPTTMPDVEFMYNLIPPSAIPETPVNACTTRFVHTSMNKYRTYVNVVRWTPDGRRLITGSASGEFTLWNGLTFNFETILQAHESSIRSLRWSRNDTWMLSGDNSGMIKYWQSNMNNLKTVQVHKEAVRGISFSPSDTKFASCSDDKTVKVWNFNTGVCENTLIGHGWDVKCLDWHPYKGIIASGSKDNLIKLWDPRAGKPITTLHGHKNTVHAVTWNRNGNWLLSGSRDQMVKIFDLRLMKEFANFKGHPKEVCSVAWHPTHELLFVSGGSEGSLLWWLADSSQSIASMLTAHTANIWALDWHPLGHILCTGSNDYTTRFWTRPRPGEAEFINEPGAVAAGANEDNNGVMPVVPNAKDQDVDDDEERGFYLPGFGTIGLLDGGGENDTAPSSNNAPWHNEYSSNHREMAGPSDPRRRTGTYSDDSDPRKRRRERQDDRFISQR